MVTKRPWISETIISGLRGSLAHRTTTIDTDDTDIFSVEVHPIDFYLGFSGYNNKETDYEYKDEDGIDFKVYDVRKFMQLLKKGNPNVHAWLWTNPEDIHHCDHRGNLLLESRESFLSTRLFRSIHGYAIQQYKKMSSGSAYYGYMGAKRKSNFEKFGFDVKNAAHCVRLLAMGEHLAKEGELLVDISSHPDFSMICSIKKGEISFGDVTKLVSQYIEDFHLAEKNCTFLPSHPPENLMNEILLEIIKN